MGVQHLLTHACWRAHGFHCDLGWSWQVAQEERSNSTGAVRACAEGANVDHPRFGDHWQALRNLPKRIQHWHGNPGTQWNSVGLCRCVPTKLTCPALFNVVSHSGSEYWHLLPDVPQPSEIGEVWRALRNWCCRVALDHGGVRACHGQHPWSIQRVLGCHLPIRCDLASCSKRTGKQMLADWVIGPVMYRSILYILQFYC